MSTRYNGNWAQCLADYNWQSSAKNIQKYPLQNRRVIGHPVYNQVLNLRWILINQATKYLLPMLNLSFAHGDDRK